MIGPLVRTISVDHRAGGWRSLPEDNRPGHPSRYWRVYKGRTPLVPPAVLEGVEGEENNNHTV